jgi:hypothetical protein
MPDISKCAGEGCFSKDRCWRYTSPPSEFRQSYANFEADIKGDRCGSYWEDERVRAKKQGKYREPRRPVEEI